jgi:hypothetical protein
MVVVVFPVADHDAGLDQRPEAVGVQAFVADAGVERFDVAVAPRLAGWDEMQPDSACCPVDHCAASEFGAIVTSQQSREGPRSVALEQFLDNEMSFDLQLAVEAKALTDINATSGIQMQAYATSVLTTLRKGLTTLETAGYAAGGAFCAVRLVWKKGAGD